MKPQQKYDECVAILTEIHDISHMMIESGINEELSALALIEEALNVLKAVDAGTMKPNKKGEPTKEIKPKKLLH
jgi:hypothetical protein